MNTMDHLNGSFDSFETEIGKDGDLFYAKALGIEVRNANQEQALNDLNQKLYDAITRGELIPNMGN